MANFLLQVPPHVSKISAWGEDFENSLPTGSMMLNKVFPGCGMTYYFLHSDRPVVLCAPRNSLLVNKTEQLDEELAANGDIKSLGGQSIEYYYFTPSAKSNAEERHKENDLYFNQLRCMAKGISSNPFEPKRFVPKILTTYDSLPTIWSIIMETREQFEVIVDEAHVLFQDYSMKPDVLERTLSVLQSHPRVIYLSATPVMRKYLEQMDTFSGLPYVELQWPKERIVGQDVFYQPMSSTTEEVLKIVNRYHATGVFDTIELEGKTYNSTEAVFYINNVRDIVRIIEQAELPPEEVNILVANDSKNRSLIRSLGQNYRLGNIPTRGKRHKPLTFCSKTVFFGCDFYSESASTFIFADANLRCMTTDISLDVCQILGRQRMESNVFRNRCTIFVKPPRGDYQDEAEFREKQQERWECSAAICKEWNKLSQDALEATKVDTTKSPYVIIYKDALTEQWICKNSINVRVAEEYAWEQRNVIYHSHASVQSLMEEEGLKIVSRPALPPILTDFYNQLMQTHNHDECMRLYCDFFDTHPDLFCYSGQLPYLNADYKNFYSLFKTAYIAQRGYRMGKLAQDYERAILRQQITEELGTIFITGQTYARKDIKCVLQRIYDKLHLRRTAKAADLAEYYNLTSKTIVCPDGQRAAGLLITRKDEHI